MDAQPKIGGFGCFKGVLQLSSICCLRRHKLPHVLTLSLSDLRQDTYYDTTDLYVR